MTQQFQSLGTYLREMIMYINIQVCKQIYTLSLLIILKNWKKKQMSFNCKWIDKVWFSSVQFSSVVQSCLTLCDPMNHSTPGLPVHHICSWIVLRNKKERTTNTTTWLNLKWIMLSKRNKTQSIDCESIYVTCLPRAGPQARGWLQILTR